MRSENVLLALQTDEERSLGDSAKSFGYNVGAFTVGAATSVVTSTGNLGIYLGNAFGGNREYLDTGEAMGAAFRAFGGDAERAKNFYDSHSAAIELTGLVVGSFIPGGLAVSGFRALQTAGKVTAGVRAATGLRNPSLHSVRLNELTRKIKMDKFDVQRKEITNMYKQGFVQQAKEALVYELATVAILNRNPILSGEDVGYFETFARNWKDIAFGAALGGGIGGALTAIGTKGAIRGATKYADEEIHRATISTVFTDSGVKAMYAGDTVAGKIDAWAEQFLRKAEIDKVTTGVIQKRGKVDALTNSLKGLRTDIIGEINKIRTRGGALADDDVGEFIANNILNQMKRAYETGGVDQFKQVAASIMHTLEGAKSIGAVNPSKLALRYDKKYLNILDTRDGEFLTQIQKEMPLGKFGASDEVAFLERGWMEAMNPETAENFFIRAASLMDSSELRTRMHNFTQAIARGEKPRNPYMSKVIKELKDLQMEFSPAYRELKPMSQSAASAVLEPANYSRAKEFIGKLEDPEYLLQKAFQWMDNEKTAKLAMKKAPTLARTLSKNNLMRKRFGETTAYLDPYTGQLQDTITAPTVRDFGKISEKGINRGEVVAGNLSIDIKKPALNIMEDTVPDAVQVSGHYYAAVKHPEKYLKQRGLEKTTELSFDDIPAMMAKAELKQNFSYTRIAPDGRKNLVEIDFSTPKGQAHYAEEMRKLKKDLAIYLRNNNKAPKTANAEKAVSPEDLAAEALSEQEIARILDVDVQTLTDNLLALNPNPESKGSLFFSKTFDPDNPSRIEINYPREYVQNAGKEGFADLAARQKMQMNMVSDVAEEIVTELSAGRNIQLIPNAARSGDNFAYRMNSQDTTASAIGSSMPDLYSGSAFTQAIGKQTEMLETIQDEFVTRQMQVVARNLRQAGAEAKAEVSAFLQSSARATKYYGTKRQQQYLGEFAENLEDLKLQAVEAGDRAALDLAEEAERVLRDLMDSNMISADLMRAIEAKDLQRILDMEAGATGPWNSHALKFKTKEAADFIEQGYEVQSRYSELSSRMAQATGHRNPFDPDLFYAGKFNIERYTHHAFVEDIAKDTMWGARKKGVVVASSPERLKEKIAEIERSFGDNVTIYTDKQSSDYLRAKGEYDAQLSMGDNFIDSSMSSRGILWDVMPETADNVIDDYLVALRGMGRESVRDTVRGYYSQEIKTLMDLHNNTTLADSAKSISRRARDKSVYKENINQMLNISNRDKYEWYYSVQEKLDEVISAGYHSVSGLFASAMSQADEAKRLEDFTAMRDAMKRFGLPEVYKDIESYIVSNSEAPKKVLQSFIASHQGLLSTLTLRMDHAQAIVNSISTPILLQPAIKEAVAAFRVPPEKLAQLQKLVGAGAGENLADVNGMSLFLQSLNRFFGDRNLVKKYEDMGYVSSLLRDVRNSIDATAMRAEFVEKIAGHKGKWIGSAAEKMKLAEDSKIRKAFELVSGITANDYSEQLVKFMATDVAFQLGKILGLNARETQVMAWNFMTRVNGNYTASQRPILFQGWMGQSIGLFQTYSFNLMQTAYRHLRDKRYGSLGSMLSLQSGIFGVQSLPGFQAMNNFIAERTFGEKDFYSTVDNLDTDRNFAAPLVYGWASAATIPLFGEGIDFFNRGDLTPRTPIMIPTSLADVPLVSFTSNFVRTIGDTASRISNGAPVGESLLQGLAKNGLNRPIGGLAELGLGYRLTNQGSMLYGYHDINAWTFAAKYMGTRTMNEAVTVNAFYRSREQDLQRTARLSELGDAVKTMYRGGQGNLDPETFSGVVDRYSQYGGRAENFNQWVGSIVQSATTSQINEMRNSLNSPTGRYMYNLTDPVPDGVRQTAWD